MEDGTNTNVPVRHGFAVDLEVRTNPSIMDHITGILWSWTLREDGKYITTGFARSRKRAVAAATRAANRHAAGTDSRWIGVEQSVAIERAAYRQEWKP